MPQRGGPWRLAKSEISNDRGALNAGARRPLRPAETTELCDGSWGVYVFARIGGELMGLVGLWEEWW